MYNPRCLSEKLNQNLFPFSMMLKANDVKCGEQEPFPTKASWSFTISQLQ